MLDVVRHLPPDVGEFLLDQVLRQREAVHLVELVEQLALHLLAGRLAELALDLLLIASRSARSIQAPGAWRTRRRA